MCKLSQLSSCNESLEGASLRVHSLQDFEDSCDSLGVLALLINPGWWKNLGRTWLQVINFLKMIHYASCNLLLIEQNQRNIEMTQRN